MSRSLNILIINRFGDPKVDSFSSDLEEILIKNGHQATIYNENLHENLSPVFNSSTPPDLVILVGGDGTILLATQRMPVQVPVVGINYGEVGFLADIEPCLLYTSPSPRDS